MDEMRVKRLGREYAQLVLNRKSNAVAVFREYKNATLPHADVMPQGLDFCEFPPVRAILIQPVEVTVDESSFSEILPLIPDFVREWRKSLDGELIGRIKHEHSMQARRSKIRRFAYPFNIFEDSEDDYLIESFDEPKHTPASLPPLDEATLPDKLKLAKTVFQCTACTHPGYGDSSSCDSTFEHSPSDHEQIFSYISEEVRPLFYPKVLGHLCLMRKKTSALHSELPDEPARQLKNSRGTRRKWTARCLRFDPRLGKCVEILAIKAGLDPEIATADDMDNLDLWFLCLKCGLDEPNLKSGVHETRGFRWRDAVGFSSLEGD